MGVLTIPRKFIGSSELYKTQLDEAYGLVHDPLKFGASIGTNSRAGKLILCKCHPWRSLKSCVARGLVWHKSSSLERHDYPKISVGNSHVTLWFELCLLPSSLDPFSMKTCPRMRFSYKSRASKVFTLPIMLSIHVFLDK
jgi:hypothetical protein